MLALGRITNADGQDIEDKRSLGLFESCIARNTSGALDQLAMQCGVPSLELITKITGAPRDAVLGNVIQYWNGFEFAL
jgi:hypothetical protein